MMDTLYRYGVSANCNGDDIYSPPRATTQRTPKEKTGYSETKDNPITVTDSAQNEEIMTFDAESLALYKKIPFEGSCAIESLTDEDMPLRKVMRCLLKLEMGRFIVMLPGEQVARKKS